MGLRPTGPATNGHAKRKLTSWIESFVEHTVDLESPEVLRQWVGISTLAAVLEQKVWTTLGLSIILPNIYTWLVAEPGIGKSNVIKYARNIIEELPEIFIAPTSVTAASLVDYMVSAEHSYSVGGDSVRYNSALLLPDELGTFMHEYDKQMVPLLTNMYDVAPYGEHRRASGIKHFVARPQINMIVGTTPSNLMKYVPDFAWDQGFTSRIFFVFSEKVKTDRDPFAITSKKSIGDLVNDLRLINALVGEFAVDTEFRERFKAWRQADYPPVPTHPKLKHYITRRGIHLFKLCMVSSVDRGDSLVLTIEDFERAQSWMFGIEENIHRIFEQGISHVGTSQQSELTHFIALQKGDIPERRLVREAIRLMPIHAVKPTLEAMERAGVLRVVSFDSKTAMKIYRSTDQA